MNKGICVERRAPHVRVLEFLREGMFRRSIIFFLFLLLHKSVGDEQPFLSHHQHQVIESNTVRSLKEENAQHHEVHCSRERSRVARDIIEQYLMPFVEQEKYLLSTNCRLHPDNDMFREQEQHKVHVDINEWRCGFCKKRFLTEAYLDQHFDNRHSNLLNDSQGHCLADLCGALHCDMMSNSKLQKTKCNPAAAAKNRHLCESLANDCFPISGGRSASRLHEFFLRQFCDAHACNGMHKPFSRGSRKQTSVFYLAICILILILLPLFYVIVYLYQREMRTRVQDLKRVSQIGRKTKPS
ncbi:uncharacterized protein LOC116251442 isoform X2 [Nymphaea colorata]|uniref:uncharacterized protein LOC116251442 isoform X2 n=1 Tax=Nymphaea colorata TaxID=210225 RepID=UPI00129D9C7C|nr:uncharacterized protein LOC116251442 isoform X2 [Nymphaea colorata]